MNISERIKRFRKEKGLTQKSLGELTKKSPQVISNWERGYTTTINHDDLIELSKALNKSIKDIVGTDFTPSQKETEEKKPKDLQKILEDHEIMFDGIPLDDEEKQEILDIIQYKLYKRAKELNKRNK